MENQVLLALKNNKLLSNILFDELNLENIKGQLITKSEGEILFRDSDDATNLFLVVSGEINLLRKRENQKTESSVIGENDFFGVDEFLQQGKRKSTAVVLRDSYIIALSKPEVDSLIEQNSGILNNLYSAVGGQEKPDLPVEEPSVPPVADKEPELKMDDGLSLEGLDDIEITQDPASETPAAPAPEAPSEQPPEPTAPADNILDDIKLDDIPAADKTDDISIDNNLPDGVLEITDDDIKLDGIPSDDITLPAQPAEEQAVPKAEEDDGLVLPDDLDLSLSEETGDGLELPDNLDDLTVAEDSNDGLELTDNLDDLKVTEEPKDDLELTDNLDDLKVDEESMDGPELPGNLDELSPKEDTADAPVLPDNLDDLTKSGSRGTDISFDDLAFTDDKPEENVNIPEPEPKKENIPDIPPEVTSDFPSLNEETPVDGLGEPDSIEPPAPVGEAVPPEIPVPSAEPPAPIGEVPAPPAESPPPPPPPPPPVSEPAPVIRKTTFSGDNNFELLEKINDAAQLVNSNIKIDDVLQNIVKVAIDLTNADRGTLYLLEEEKNELWSKIAVGSEFKEIKLKVGNGIAGWVAQKGETINLDNAQEDSRFNVQFDKTSGYVTKSMLCFPVKDRNGDIVGVLQLLNSKNGKFSNVDEELLEALSIHASMALQNAELVEQLLKGERISSLGKMANFLIQDIKKPVMVSKRYTEHLKSKDLPEESMKVIELLLEQLDHIAELVNSTSNYSEGQIISRSHLGKLNEVLEDFVKRIDSYVKSRNCTLVSDFVEDVDVNLSEKQLYQAFQHLVKNACDAMPDGGEIQVFTEIVHKDVTITVKDSGLGIPETLHEKIFEPFMSHGKKEGTGLGLSITRKIIEEHGGNISVESDIGEGAKFIISLPIAST